MLDPPFGFQAMFANPIRIGNNVTAIHWIGSGACLQSLQNADYQLLGQSGIERKLCSLR
jgi:hypothetical protein